MEHRGLQELDVVALTVDLPAEGLARGQVGTIVHVYSLDFFEVEFVNSVGSTYALLPLAANQLLQLHYEPAAA